MTAVWAMADERDDLSRATLLEDEISQVGAGTALLRVDRVGVTANNVTYGMLGEAFRDETPHRATLPALSSALATISWAGRRQARAPLPSSPRPRCASPSSGSIRSPGAPARRRDTS